ncbi:hypothetical protein [Aeribacillus composti]|uniref:hypothetical protein n=1 Tax=Aeribacillus composti TaxID=1868734 RepID=UPI003D1C466B
MEQQNNTTYVELEQPQKSRKKRITILLILYFVLACALGWGGYNLYQQKKEKEAEEFGENLNFLVMNMLNTGADAEEMVNTYIDVWHDAIFNDTFGVEVGGERYYDFDSAVTAQKSEFEQDGKIEELQKSLDKTERDLKKLKNPPDEYKEAYELAVDMYKSHKEFVEYAISPSGSLQSYSDDARKLSQEFISLYDEYNIKVPKTYLDNLKEDLEKDLEKVKKENE